MDGEPLARQGGDEKHLPSAIETLGYVTVDATYQSTCSCASALLKRTQIHINCSRSPNGSQPSAARWQAAIHERVGN